MATRQIKMPVKDKEDTASEMEEAFSQSKRPERGRYLLQVDRQTKGSYTTAEAAQKAALVIKTGYPIVQVRGDNTAPHTMENSFRKAYTARTLRSPSGALAERLKADPNLPFIHLSNVIAFQGALPIKIGEETIGAAGASGAPGGEKDEACVKAGIDKVADQLK